MVRVLTPKSFNCPQSPLGQVPLSPPFPSGDKWGRRGRQPVQAPQSEQDLNPQIWFQVFSLCVLGKSSARQLSFLEHSNLSLCRKKATQLPPSFALPVEMQFSSCLLLTGRQSQGGVQGAGWGSFSHQSILRNVGPLSSPPCRGHLTMS